MYSVWQRLLVRSVNDLVVGTLLGAGAVGLIGMIACLITAHEKVEHHTWMHVSEARKAAEKASAKRWQIAGFVWGVVWLTPGLVRLWLAALLV